MKFKIKTLIFYFFILLFMTACSQSNTVLSDVSLLEDPGAKKPVYVPNGTIKRGEYVKVLEKKDINGKSFSQVQIEGVSTKGWLETKWIHEGKLKSVTVIRDADMYTRPNSKSPKSGRVKAGQVAFELEKSEKFSLIQYPGKEAYIESANLGDGSQVIKTINISGLGSATVSATSQFKSGEGKELQFDPRNLFDGSLQTAWCEGKEGDDGIGESVTLNFANMVNINRISIVTGWTKSEELFKLNNRVSRIRIESDNGASTTAELQDDNYDYQPIELPNGLSGYSFRIIIDEVHKGKDPDTCLSEIKIEGSQMPQGGPY